MKATVDGIRVRCITAALPERQIKIEDSDYGDPETTARFREISGIESRHICDEDQTFSDLAFVAASKALELLGWHAEEISLFLVVTQSPDLAYPGTACLLHGRLGLAKECAAFDINLGCSGYPYGLYTASSFLAHSDGDKALLVVGDTAGKPSVGNHDEAVAPLFGDAASATALQRDCTAPRLYFSMNTDGTGWDHIYCRFPGGRPGVQPDELKLSVDNHGNVGIGNLATLKGSEVTSFALREVPKAILAALAMADLTIDDPLVLILHQANLLTLKSIARKLKLDMKRVPSSLRCHGNTSSCSVPLTMITHLMENAHEGVAKILLCGFGVGLSWSTAIMEIDEDILLAVVMASSDTSQAD